MTLHGTNEKRKRLKMQVNAGEYFQSHLVFYTGMAVLSSMYVLLENVQGNIIIYEVLHCSVVVRYCEIRERKKWNEITRKVEERAKKKVAIYGI